MLGICDDDDKDDDCIVFLIFDMSVFSVIFLIDEYAWTSWHGKRKERDVSLS